MLSSARVAKHVPRVEIVIAAALAGGIVVGCGGATGGGDSLSAADAGLGGTSEAADGPAAGLDGPPISAESETCVNGVSCGACGFKCDEGSTCVDDACVCPRSLTSCSGGCKDLATDVTSCGVCGHACSRNNATSSCQAGACRITCQAGYGDCDRSPDDGCEVDLANDASNCGRCGVVCAAGSRCSGGQCLGGTSSLPVTCPQGHADCDGIRGNGCETDLESDANNCGRCGVACGAAAHVNAASCATGACTVAYCAPGWADCDAKFENGCEVNLAVDANNCGKCGAACAAGANAAGSACVNSVCQLVGCAAGYGDCDGKPENGCEANLTNDISNCGGCGSGCPVPANGGSVACSGGGCQLTSCQPGYADCDRSRANGCEVAINTDVHNCGACGMSCSGTCSAGFCVAAGCTADSQCAMANATGVCRTGSCQIGVCTPGYADCNGVAGDGCECPARVCVSSLANNKIAAFDLQSSGATTPLRYITGGNTALSAPVLMDLDTVHQELVVANNSAAGVTVYAWDASGNVTPLRHITGLGSPSAVLVDNTHDELFVADFGGARVFVLSRSANGVAAPLRTITGGATGLGSPVGMAIDLTYDELLVINRSTKAVRVFSRTANGNVAPLRSIVGVATTFTTPDGIVLDTARDEIFVSDFGGGGAISVFPRTANGNVAPSRRIAGGNTLFATPEQILLDPARDQLHVVNRTNNAVLTFPRTADGNVVPLSSFTNADGAFGSSFGLTFCP
jgi:6-phosphogluconolactonase (cycloisomerase 2 family)